MLNILLLAHDLADAAIDRRTFMLHEGGANVVVAGFRRGAHTKTEIQNCPVIEIGQTRNGGFIQRIISVLREVIFIKKRRSLFSSADVVIARNLEMLAIAVAARRYAKPEAKIVYEVLDVHRLLLGQKLPNQVLRALEGWLSKRASLLITSSPAFVSEYFNKISKVNLPVRLIENKIPALHSPLVLASTGRPLGPKWFIGWFGVLRCSRSLHILRDLVRQSGDMVEVILRGKPALDQIPDFHDIIATTPGLRFLGPYLNPDDLASIYGQVHFTWAIDMYEEGLNSSWLLPNRLYEGGAFGGVPIAVDGLETARFLQKQRIGVLLLQPLLPQLTGFFRDLTPNTYEDLTRATHTVAPETWSFNRADCQNLVATLAALQSPLK